MTTTAIIILDLPGPFVSRHVYGHVAGHLGRCVYGGFWVGEDSKVSNVRGIRADVVEALRIPNLRWLSLANLDIDSPAEVVLDLRGRTARCRGARILTAPTPASHNTPRTACAVAPAAFDGVREHPRGLLVELPPHSYLAAELQLT